MMVAIVALGSSYCIGIEKKREGERWNDRKRLYYLLLVVALNVIHRDSVAILID